MVLRQWERSARRPDAVVVVRQLEQEGTATAASVVRQVTALKGKVHGVHVGREGRVIIRAADSVEAARIAKGLTSVELVSVGKRLPKAIVFGVPAEMATGEILREALEIPVGKTMSVVRKTTSRGEGYDAVVNVVVEIDADQLQRLEQQGRVYIGHRSCAVREDVDTGRCYKCGQFDQTMAACKAEQRTCWRCGKEGHAAAGCKEAARCNNCAKAGLPSKHLTRSLECPYTRRAEARVRANIKYDE